MPALFLLRRAAVAATLLLAACGPAAPVATAPVPAAAALENAAATITAEDMHTRIALLAADSMRGRDTPSPELEKAARYLADEFRRMGLQPAGDANSFIQRFPYRAMRLDPASLVLGLKGQTTGAPRYTHNYFLLPGMAPRADGPAFYAGGALSQNPLPAKARSAVVLFDVPGASPSGEWQQGVMAALQRGMQAGAAAVGVILDPAFPADAVAQLAPAVAAQQLPVPVFGITREAAQAMLVPAGVDLNAARNAGKPTVLKGAVIEVAATQTGTEHQIPNVVAILPGSDPALRDSYVVLSAHFDHVGVGRPDEQGDSIFNGADDNASGTSGLLEIAEAFSKLPTPPARSVVFLAVSGEEKGLLGSTYYVAHPTVPAAAIVANLNMDMIGRNAPDTVIVIGQEYSTLVEKLGAAILANPELGLTAIRDPYPAEEMLFFRSDQLPFIRAKIPALFFFTGLHEDYHALSDEVERIDPEKAARVARLIFYIAHDIATDPTLPTYTEEGWRQVEAILQGAGS
jgi:hypothetical protein